LFSWPARGIPGSGYREGQEDQLGALSLVVNVSVLRNNSAYGCSAEVVGRLSPLADKHFNVFGRYHFTVTDSILMAALRPLRDPDAPEELLWAAEA
jgi:hypothetical protein